MNMFIINSQLKMEQCQKQEKVNIKVVVRRKRNSSSAQLSYSSYPTPQILYPYCNSARKGFLRLRASRWRLFKFTQHYPANIWNVCPGALLGRPKWMLATSHIVLVGRNDVRVLSFPNRFRCTTFTAPVIWDINKWESPIHLGAFHFHSHTALLSGEEWTKASSCKWSCKSSQIRVDKLWPK